MYITEIYPAREAPLPGVSSELIYNELRPDMEKHLCRKEEVPALVEQGQFDVLAVLGAGDLDNYVPQLTEILRPRA